MKRANWIRCLRNLFRYPKNLSYLNSGSMALSPIAVLDRVQKEKEAFELNPTDGLMGAWPRMWEAQKNLARFFNADPKHLYLRANVTLVMNDFIMALQLPENSEILISDIEYGAIVQICQYKAKLEGHKINVVSLHDANQEARTITEDQILSRIEKALTPKTKLVMLSHVMTGSGLRLPIEKIAKLLRSKNIFFAVDGAHGAGSCELDFSNTQLDFYGTNLHKWLMGPKGTGFGYVAPEMREHLVPKWAGWTTMDLLPHHALFGEGDAWTARWMICSTHNFSDFYGISEIVKFWNDQGPEKILNRQRELTAFTANTVSEMTRWPCMSAFPTEELRGPLVAFKIPENLAQKGFELMFILQAQKQLVVSMTMIQNQWAMRLSPHVYNTEDEITQAAKILKDFKL